MKPKKCAGCGNKFAPVRQFQKACSVECSVLIVAANRQKAKRKQYTADKKRLKSRADWLREAQKVFNKYVRIRDSGLGCISCGAKPENKYGGAMDCGHYRSIGSAHHLRFNLHNTAAQCVKCNRYLSSNSVEYRKGLISRIGVVAVEALECNNASARFSVEYLMRVKAVFAKKAAIATRRMKCKVEEAAD